MDSTVVVEVDSTASGLGLDGLRSVGEGVPYRVSCSRPDRHPRDFDRRDRHRQDFLCPMST